MPTILFLGRSYISGYGLNDPSSAWPHLIVGRLAARTGVEIRTELRRLNIDGDPTEYLERVFAEVRPDIIVASLTSYDYATARIQEKVNERLGKRLGDLARAIEKKTLPRDGSRTPGLLHRGLKRAGRRWVGVAPQRTREDVMFANERMFRCIARQEQAAAVMSYICPGAALTAENPGYEAAAERFREETKRRTDALHFHWADVNLGNSQAPYRLSDGIHINERGHEIYADEMESAMFAALRDVAPGIGTLTATHARDMLAAHLG